MIDHYAMSVGHASIGTSNWKNSQVFRATMLEDRPRLDPDEPIDPPLPPRRRDAWYNEGSDMVELFLSSDDGTLLTRVVGTPL
jgi:hypothetical protein